MTPEAKRPFTVLDTGMEQAGAEEAILEFWRRERIFERSVEERTDAPPFVFFEGPPTTNGRPGVHHVLGRTIKDLICRFWTMQGYKVRRKGGWDTHGLPVEIEVEKELGIEGKNEIEAYGLAEFNARCRQSVFKYKDEWNRITERIGFWIDLDHPYVTLENDYIETVWYLIKRFWDKGLVYAGFKVVPYCPRCGTALSDHEVSQGYKEVTEPAVYVKFALADEEDAYILAWTTTPWTLPGNVALAVGGDIDYIEVEQTHPRTGKTERYVLAGERAEILRGESRVVRTVKGRDLVGRSYRPLFDGLDLGALTGKKAYYVADADFVTTEDGTGVVHTAVMYGADDYALGDRLDLPKHHTVDETGHFTAEVPEFGGARVKDVDGAIIDHLKRTGSLYAVHDYTHNYPFCWRCDSALIYYARDSWYLRTTALRDTMISENASVRWFPEMVGKNRFGNWLEGNVDWAISRDRYWGTPFPLWTCEASECGATVCIGSRAQLAECGAEVPDDLDLHRPAVDAVTFPCEACGRSMVRVKPVIDVWFDSGAMPFAQWHYPFENRDVFEESFPADFISEGIDQSRGWFYSLLAISVMERGVTPYRAVLSNELVLDEEGRKMSKRLGNTVDSWEILGHEGADALRWYLVGNSPPWVPTRFSRGGVTETARKLFGTLRNVASFFATYANVDGWTPAPEAPPVSERAVLDRWILSRLDATAVSMDAALRGYQITRAARTLSAFIQDEVSNWYVRRNRRRFWKGEPGPDKDAAYATLHEVLATVSRLIAPFAPFQAEILHRALVVPYDPGAPDSVHLCRYPEPAGRRDKALEERMQLALDVTEAARAARTEAGLKVRQPLARLMILGSGSQGVDPEVAEIVAGEINVKEVVFSDASAVMTLGLKPRFGVLGPRFGGAVNAVAAAIRALDDAAVREGLPGGGWIVRPEGMEETPITAGEVEVEEAPRAGFSLSGAGGVRVALDMDITPELRREGLVRELVHRLQNLRKDRGLDLTDRVLLGLAAGGDLGEALREHESYIRAEVLADAVSFDTAVGEEAWDLDGTPVSVSLRPSPA